MATPYDSIAEKYGIELIIRFGSSAKGRLHGESDLDLAIARRPHHPRWTWDDLIDIEYEIWKVIRPAEEIDLVDISRASPLLLGEIARHGKPEYLAHPESYIRFFSWAMRRYEDNDKWFRRQASALGTAVHAS
ncbi:MAG: nucleotidyltransferase domain-containing protein [Candidatus Hydrogenedentota bacterium]